MPVATAVTAVTSQGVNGIDGVQLIEPDVIARQIRNAFEMYEIAAIKIGMLGTAKNVMAVADELRQHERPPTVIDPVLRSTSGTQLLDDAGIKALLDELLPMCTLLTPNIEELGVLGGAAVSTEHDRIHAARCLINRGAKAVLIKGGHLNGDPVDILVEPDDRWARHFDGHRVSTEHSRGTGCTLSSLIAGRLAGGTNLDNAIRSSKRALENALRMPVVPRSGRGYPAPSHLADLRDRVARISGIYFVSDSALNPNITHAVGGRLASEGGAKVIQLRDKRLDLPSLVKLGKLMREAAQKRDAIFIVNDRVDVAIACDADGVHLGPDDMDAEDASRVLGPAKVIGASVSTIKEARSVAPFVSYLAVGAVFGSSTKGDAGDPVGVERIREIKNAFPDKKIVAIGGINMSNIASVAAAGADAAAVVSAIVCAPDPEQATRELLAEFERGKSLRSSQRTS